MKLSHTDLEELEKISAAIYRLWYGRRLRVEATIFDRDAEAIATFNLKGELETVND